MTATWEATPEELVREAETAERDRIVAWLRELNESDHSHNYWSHIALRIERGDHL